MCALKKKNIFSMFLYIYVFIISWNDVFSISAWLRPYIIISIVITTFSFFYILNSKFVVNKIFGVEDVCIYMILIWLLIESLIVHNSKTINYLFAYSYVFIILYLLFKIIYVNYTDIRILLKVNYFGILFISGFVIVEFLLRYFGGINIFNYFPRYFNQATALYASKFPRSYGFSTEPGVVAYYFTTLGPLALFYLWHNNISNMRKIIITLTIVIGFIFTFSATGIAAILISSLAVIGFYFVESGSSKKKIFITFLLISLIIGIFGMDLSTNMYTRGIYNKLTLGSSTSSNIRVEAWDDAISKATDHIFIGEGLGATSDKGNNSYRSWYLTLLIETGVMPVILLFSFFLINAIKIIRIKSKSKYYYLFGLIAGILHLSVTSTFQYPFIFLLLIIFNVSKKDNAKYIMKKY